ncbi:hypothetical protein FQN52_000195 [Onygenales sp. PD_12]|nr:hypothetical protein FQN53_003368 [Emmonsiellopsis sp. PD_33]KAK2793865.1 hypothetical protein FQN52_000195 [Onygenales sp. PD_12]KAK2802566.1 hypothetical protein FQN51_004358 [Onygenales sp. PD_10]
MAEISPQESELQLLSPQRDDSGPAETGSERVDKAANGFPLADIAKWPQEGRTLKRNACNDKFLTALETVLATIPTLFLVLGILAIRLDGKQISGYGEKIVQATKLGPSIFPIVFAAIVGNMLRRYALWRVENCAPLGLLEQLNSSTSFAGTVISILALRRFGILTTAILLLWAMSPLGGQSALRMLSQTSSELSQNISVAYMNMNNPSGFSGTASMGDTLGATDSLYTASLLATQGMRSSPRDLWSWPKIPLLRALPPNESDTGSNPWRTCSQENQTVYSSLVGLMIQGIPSDKETEFAVESSYFDLDCVALAHHAPLPSIFDMMGGNILHHNSTNLFRNTANFPNAPALARSNLFIDTSYNFTAPSPTQSHVNLFYGSLDTFTHAALFNCTVSTVHVESWIACQNGSCSVTRMRQSKRDTRPSSLTPFNDRGRLLDNWTTLNNIITQFPFAAGVYDNVQSSPTDSYIYNDASLFGLSYNRNWSSVSDQAVSTRFTTLFNTYWQASLAPFALGSTSRFEQANLTSEEPLGAIPSFNGTATTAFWTVTVYRASWAWVTVFIIATVLLQFAAIAGLLLNWLTTAPDILGYVSSLTRENAYIAVPDGGSSLSGLERARLLQDLPVQIVDVHVEKEMGYIALASEGGDDDFGGQRLNRRRKYC